MKDTDIENFIQLNHKQKYEKIVSIFDMIKSNSQFLADLGELITQIQDIDDELIISLYKTIISIINETSEEKIKKWINNLISIQEKIRRIQQKEKEECENPDNLLIWL